jgi:hypothetical protein
VSLVRPKSLLGRVVLTALLLVMPGAIALGLGWVDDVLDRRAARLLKGHRR